MSDLPPGVQLLPAQDTIPLPAGVRALPPGVKALPPPDDRGMLSKLWDGLVGSPSEKGQPAAEQRGGLDRLWHGLVGLGPEQSLLGGFAEKMARGNLLGLPGPSALERNYELSQQRSRQPGEGIGKMMPTVLDNPLVGAFGPGNIGMAGRAPSAAAGRIADFEAQGVTPSIPAIGQTRATGLAARAGTALPFSPVTRGLEQNVGEVAQAAEQRAGQYGTATADSGGQIAQNALKRFAADKAQSVKDYGEFWRLMHGAPNAPVTQTLRVLNDIYGRFPNAPELEGLFTNPKLNRMRDSLTPRTVNIPAQQSPILNQFGQPSTVTPASTVQRGGALSIPELKELKTQVGYMLEKPPEEIPRAQLKQLYASLGGDLRTAAAQRSPAAARALAKADANFAKRMTMMDALSSLVDKDAPEGVFRAIEMAAGEGAGAHASLLRTAKEAIGPTDWGDVAASMIRRLGNPRPGQPPMPNVPPFSVETFATNFRKMSPKAKEVMFGPDRPGTPRDSLEQLGRVAGDLQNVNRLAGRHGFMQAVGASSIITELVTMLAMGRAPTKELAGLTGAYGVSKALMTPWFAKLVYAPPDVAREMVSGMGRAGVVDAAILESGETPERLQKDRELRHSAGAH
jgi:hypothetical protein